MAYEYEEENIRKLNSYNILSGGSNITKPTEELQEVYRKAKAFDEIVNEFHYQLQNLESWDTLDQKDCQTLKQILEENIKERADDGV